MTQFSDFGLKPSLEKALAAKGYVTPTPIQAQAIPPALKGKDILGIAQTGTGKTAAFALPILHRLLGNSTRRMPRACRTLVLSPTRELASQIADSFRTYGQFMDMKVGVVFGGVPIPRQEKMLSPGLDILVATPGRLLDLTMRKSLNLAQIEILVLDEADQMFDLGFLRDLKKIVALLPTKRQTMFFSATMLQAIKELANAYIHNPVEIAVTPVASTAERIEQHVIFTPQSHKQAILTKLVHDLAIDRALVFTRTKHGADRVVRLLERDGIEAAAIHGNKSQNARERALAAFRKGSCRLLIATDIAARGIDVDGVSHVINFELPNVPESYVHRIGRTARAGREGLAISFCADDERPYLRDIEKLTRQKVNVMAVPEGTNLAPVELAARPSGEARAQHRHRHAGKPGEAGHREGGHREGGYRKAGEGGQRKPNGPRKPFRARKPKPQGQGQRQQKTAS